MTRAFGSTLLALATALALSACGETAEDHAERTGNAIAADVHAATDNVTDSVDALAGSMTNSLDRVAASSLRDAAERTDAAAGRLERDIRAHTDKARGAASDTLQNAGAALRDP